MNARDETTRWNDQRPCPDCGAPHCALGCTPVTDPVAHHVNTRHTITFDHPDFWALHGTIETTPALFSPYGDAVKGGYNGGWSMIVHGQHVAYLDYQTHPDIDHVLVAMVDVHPDHRRNGYATALLARLQIEFPDTRVSYGAMTPDGARFFAAVTPHVVNNNEVAR